MGNSVLDLSSLDGSNGFRLNGSSVYSSSGYSVNNVGDINGDGFDDVAVGARTEGGGVFIGTKYVIFGRPAGFDAEMELSSLDGSHGFRLVGTTPYDRSTISIENAGDVNGDGVKDMLVHVLGFDLPGDRAGFNYVVFGRASNFTAALDLSNLDGSDGFQVLSEPDSNPNISIHSAGDINGDGFDDVIVGSTTTDPNGLYSSSSHIVFGHASGFDATLDLSNLDGQNGFVLNGAVSGGESFYAINSAGDVNGDGLDDVLVGTPKADPHGSDSGSAYVVFGRTTAFDAVLDLSKLDGTDGFRLDGVAESDLSGSVVTSVGDFNGDGFDDVIVDAPFANKYTYNYNTYAHGTRYVVFGKESGFDAVLDLSHLDGHDGFRLDGVSDLGSSISSAGDMNGDGLADFFIEDRINVGYSSSDFCAVVFGKASGFDAAMDLSDLDGFSLVAGESSAINQNPDLIFNPAGDINGDGFDDLIVGVTGSTKDEPNESGSSYVVFGKASGFASTLDLFDSNLNDVLRINGIATGDYLGSSVSGAGDVNGDGFDDLVVGARGANSSYVIFGNRDFGGGGSGELPEITGTADADTLRGTTAAEHFIAGDGKDNLLGLGGADIFDAGAGDDAIRIGDLTFASIDGGEGNDALHLAGSGMNLDLSVLGDQIHSIETICLYGRGDNTLTLTADSLLNLSDSTNTLKVHGNTDDHIVVQDSGWIDGGSQGFYHSYTHDDVVLLVGANVVVELV